MLATSDYLSLDALDMAQGIVRKDWTCSELVDCAIRLAEQLNPRLNAITSPAFDQARQLAARIDREASRPAGPLAGVPFLVKEVSAVAGMPHHLHSRLFANELADHDAPIVSAFKQAGLVSLGTTNTPELCLTITTESLLKGPCHNPWHLDHSTGGSSGGSAAAVAARIVPLAHGSDGGGSIRIPAACCGVFGLKVSRGLTPVEPQRHLSWSGLSVGHVLSRTVRDSAAVLDSIRLREPGLYPLPAPVPGYLAALTGRPGRLRIALHREHPNKEAIATAVASALERTADLCRELGHQVEEASPPIDYRELARHFRTVTEVHTAQTILPQLEKTGLDLSAAPLERAVKRMAERGAQISASEFVRALDALHAAAQAMAEFHKSFAVILSPVTALPPVPLGWLNSDSDDLREYGHRFGAYSGFCALYNATGQPSMSVPLCTSPDGLPLGMMFSAAWGADAELLQLAGQLETASPWAGRRPPLLNSTSL